jgi:serine/threonine-protein kinase
LIERMLERGRMGTVLLAGDQQTKGTVAVRIIDPAYSEDRVERLFSQRDILLAANHPHLVPIVEMAYEAPGSRGGIPYLVEQYSPGKTLDEVLSRQRSQNPAGLPFDRAMEIALAVVTGIEYAHELGVVHGNLKDDKIYIDGDQIQIGGLGLGHLDEGLDLTDAPRLHQVVTYLAPEQVRGRPIGIYTDLYALGVLLYQLFGGRPPFEGGEREVLRAHLEEEPPPLDAPPIPAQAGTSRCPGLPDALEALIFKLLAKNPADRCDSVTAVRRDLQEVVSEQ